MSDSQDISALLQDKIVDPIKQHFLENEAQVEKLCQNLTEQEKRLNRQKLLLFIGLGVCVVWLIALTVLITLRQ